LNARAGLTGDFIGSKGGVMAVKNATKGKPRKVIKKAVAKQAISDIDTLIKSGKKLDLELKKIKGYIKKMLGHQYFT
jgi:hypothetical protein